MKKRHVFLSTLISFLFSSFSLLAQFQFAPQQQEAETPIKWKFSNKQLSNDEFKLIFTASCDDGWHLYSHIKTEGSPIIPTTVNLDKSSDYEITSELSADRKAHKAYDKLLKTNYGYFDGTVNFSLNIKLLSDKATVTGFTECQACNDEMCLPPSGEDFSFALQKKIAKSETKKTEKEEGTAEQAKKDEQNQPAKAQTEETKQTTEKDSSTAAVPVSESPSDLNNSSTNADQNEPEKDIYASVDASSETDGQSMLWIFIFGFLSGLIALLTPCVFPMIPMTVSFFMKSQDKGKGLKNALIYGFSIIILYVSLGLMITGIFGAESLTEIAANAWLNLAFFILLVVFAVSFFGAFEISLPSSWANYFDQKSSQTSGFISIFFMAFTLAIVSFSCTGPLIGGLIVEAVSQGSFYGPAAGMTGFAFAIALPFTLFAMFPSWLNSLPKSGGWLNVVKVSIGFIELAFSLKFLSTADLAKHWGLLPREAFISLWIVIFALYGMYMLGKIKFSHDSDTKHVSIPRFFIGMISFAFAVYMLPGLWGAPLKSISAFVPPLSTQDFDLYTPSLTASVNNYGSNQANSLSIPDNRINSDIFHSPYGIKSFFDYEEGMAFAKKANKPVFIDFTGQACTNCRQMEAAVWSDPQALNMLMNDYIVISLYTDDQSMLPENEQKTVEVNGRKKRVRTIGNKWSLFQIQKFGTTSLPSYFILNTDGSLLINHSFGFERDAPKFVQFLKDGITEYEKQGK